MNFINTAIAVFGILIKVAPLVEQLIRMAEVTFNMPQEGKDKLEYVMSEVKLAFQAEQTLSNSVAWDVVAPFLGRNIAAKVKVLFPAPTLPAAPAIPSAS